MAVAVFEPLCCLASLIIRSQRENLPLSGLSRATENSDINGTISVIPPSAAYRTIKSIFSPFCESDAPPHLS
jgi:hypothetical protein